MTREALKKLNEKHRRQQSPPVPLVQLVRAAAS